MMKGVLVYISGPISPTNGLIVERNVVNALEVFFDLSRQRIPAFCPHIQAIYPSAHQIDYRLWMEYDFAVIDRCTHMLMMENFRESKGALEELAYADAIGMPVAYSMDELLAMLKE